MANHYRFTQSNDGTPRIDVKIEVRLSLDDIVDIVTASIHDDGAVVLAASYITTKRAVMDRVKNYIEIHGKEKASYYVGDNNLDDLRDNVETAIRELRHL